MNAIKYHWCEASLLSQAVWHPKISSLSRSLRKGLVLHPAKNEEIYGIVLYQKISCHVTLLKKEASTCGSQVGVTSGLFRCDPLSFNPVIY